jgi:F0F1-type ATP synthase assembly protein I
MDSSTRNKAMKSIAPYVGLGTELVAAVVGFGAVGWFIDSKFDTSPMWMLLLLLLGMIGGMYNFIKAALKSSQQPSAKTVEQQESQKQE